jgi:hypothetical protein
MRIISKILLLLVLTQLGACAVMSKKECLAADWRLVGYGVAVNGDTDISEAYNRRQQTCSKYGASADWRQFQQGHADGIVEYCQLDNAAKLGANGISRVVDHQVCAERDYPGFRQAFNVGYKLHILRSRVADSYSAISNLTSSQYRYQQSIRRIRHRLEQQNIEESEHKQLRRELRHARSRFYQIDREIDHYQQRLYREKSAANDYADNVYDDYLFTVSDTFIDPRIKKSTVRKPKQTDFDDRIDDILNQ